MIFNKKKKIDIRNLQLPQHIGIIMDGNGRWAKKRSMPRTAGHTAGAKTFRKIARYCSNIGIKHLTVYAFSTENWTRPKEEVNILMGIFKSYLEEAISDFKDDSIVVRFIGDQSKFSKELQDLVKTAEEESKHRNGMVLNVATNYGGQDEILKAVKEISSEILENKLKIEDISKKTISQHLYTQNQPDPEIIIRTSGEFRTSNFMLWQSAYSEYIITEKLWPDFTSDDIDDALYQFSKRKRRFGGI